MPNFRPIPLDPTQIILFPVSVDEAVPADCDARLLGEAMDLLPWREFEASYAETGCPAYPPREMCKLLIYGYSKGVRSSRALEEAAKYDVRLKWLLRGYEPDHCTISRFRKDHEAELKAVYRSTVRLCAEAGLVLLRVVATDGTKIRARASRRSVYGADRLAREAEAIDRVLAEAEAADQAEDEQANGELPPQLAEAKQRREKLAEVATQLEATGRRTAVATEPDCRVMKTGDGLRPAYNAQLTVDGAHGVIVAAELTQAENDCGQLAGQLEQVTENVGCRPEMVLADTGYSDEGTFQTLADTGQQALIPPREQPQRASSEDPFSSKYFVRDEQRDALICPAGRELSFRRVARCSSGHYREYTAGDCRDCPFFAQCVRPKGKRGRSVQVSVVEQQREAMRQRLRTPQGKALYRRRQEIGERPIAQIKSNLRFPRFGLAGFGGASAEYWLLCAAHNLRVHLRHALGVAGSSRRHLAGAGGSTWRSRGRRVATAAAAARHALARALFRPVANRIMNYSFCHART